MQHTYCSHEILYYLVNAACSIQHQQLAKWVVNQFFSFTGKTRLAFEEHVAINVYICYIYGLHTLHKKI